MKTGFTQRKCPKCGGDLYLDSNYCIEGNFISWYEEETCLQCGFIYSAEIPQQVAAQARPAVRQLIAV